MESQDSIGVWSSEADSQVFRESVEHEVLSCQSGQQSILDMVQKLGELLISTDDSKRYKGTLVLAEVIERASSTLKPKHLPHIVSFLNHRMADWPCFKPALKGCLALAKLGSGAHDGLRLSDEDAAAMASALLEVNVRGLVAADRLLCLELLVLLFQEHGAALLERQVNLLEGVVAALDGEGDPRCLLQGFQAIRELCCLYAQHDPGGLAEKAEEVVDLLGSYFPVMYTQPPNMPGCVTRAELATAVEQALAAVPVFAPHVIPLLLQKLSSSVRQARQDALALLATCATSYGAAAMTPHLVQIWNGLRLVLTAGIDGSSAPDERAEAKALSSAAITAVSALASAFGREQDMSLVDLVAEDSLVRDLLEDAVDPAQHGGPAGSSARLEAASPVIAAVARSSKQAADRVSQKLLGLLTSSAYQGIKDSDRSVVEFSMALICTLVKACQEVYAEAYQQAAGTTPHTNTEQDIDGLSLDLRAQDAPATVSAGAGTASVLAGKGADLARLAAQSAAPCPQPDANASADTPTDHRPQDVKRHSISNGTESSPRMAYPTHELKIISRLLSFPATHPALPPAQQQDALLGMLSAFCAPSALSAAASAGPMQSAFPADPQPEDQSRIEQAAAFACEAMAALGHGSLLSSIALPRLFTTARLDSASSAASVSAAPDEVAVHGGGSWGTAQGSSQAACVGAPEDTWRAKIALHALARIACTSSALRQPILTRMTQALQAALSETPNSDLLDVMAHAELLQQAGEAACSQIASTLLSEASAHPAREDRAIENLAKGMDTLMRLATCYAWSRQHALAAAAERTLAEAVRAAESGRCRASDWLPAAPAASALSVLPPITDAQRLHSVASGLVSMACSAAPPCIAGLAADSAAAVLNKAPADICDGALAKAWANGILPRLQQGSSAAGFAAGRVGRALAMRGHPRSQEMISAAIDLACTDSSTGQSTANASRLAPDILQAMVRPVEEESALGRCRQLTNVRPFWQQRTLSMASSAIVQRLEQTGEQQGREILLACLAAMVGTLPQQLVQPQWAQLLPWLVAALQPLGASRPDLQPALLSSLQQALRDPQGRMLLEAEIKDLMGALLHEAEHAQQAAQRAAALSSLQEAVQMPYSLLHPLRPHVMRSLDRAVDDRKRDVRMAAVRCRRAWTAPHI